MSVNQQRHEHFMKEALAEAKRAGERGDVPVGCVIVRNGVVIGRGANEIERTGDPTRHAEIVAIEDAVETAGEKFLEDCAIYVTLEPCSMCAGAIVLARIPTIVFGAHDAKTGAVRSLFELTDDPRLNHRCIVRTGVLEGECATVLTEFFAAKRSEAPSHEPFVEPVPEPTGVGLLVLVPTPIGNLEDVTKRALEMLRDASVVFCEDTRRTGLLLQHFGIQGKHLVSNHDHNERQRAEEAVQRIRRGEIVALVSDAGMPAISDPGYRAVKACRDAGLPVMALPGASAALTAAAASGLPTDELYFVGFPPQKKGRKTFLDRVLATSATVVLYESPYRLEKLLQEIVDRDGADRPVVVARELTKKFEEYITGSAAEVLAAISARGGVKGECVVVVGQVTS